MLFKQVTLCHAKQTFMSGVYGRPVVIEWNIYLRSQPKKLILNKRQIKRKIPLGSRTKNRQPPIYKKYICSSKTTISYCEMNMPSWQKQVI